MQDGFCRRREGDNKRNPSPGIRAKRSVGRFGYFCCWSIILYWFHLVNEGSYFFSLHRNSWLSIFWDPESWFIYLKSWGGFRNPISTLVNRVSWRWLSDSAIKLIVVWERFRNPCTRFLRYLGGEAVPDRNSSQTENRREGCGKLSLSAWAANRENFNDD